MLSGLEPGGPVVRVASVGARGRRRGSQTSVGRRWGAYFRPDTQGSSVGLRKALLLPLKVLHSPANPLERPASGSSGAGPGHFRRDNLRSL